MARLPSSVQGRVLKLAGQVLETGSNFWSAKNAKDKERHLQKRCVKDQGPVSLSRVTSRTIMRSTGRS